jgi:AcrR family transcriptional regulator
VNPVSFLEAAPLYQRSENTERRLAARRSQLLAAARAIVAEGGFDALRIGALASRAGVATGTVYRYFDSRATLAVEVFSQASQREVDAMDEALQAQGIAAAVRTWVQRAQAAPVLARALLSEPVCPEVEAARLAFRARYAELLAAAIRDAVDAGRLPTRSPTTSAACIVGALGEAVLGPHGPADPDDVVQFCMQALGPPQEHP